ncbi:phospholysine phosphohistidine inorganic pyrophosphate phosphatase-like [Uloborus diversus]|uniref:phospholysine phosphohistidine inorganic pyrophosphate phosphatase-like n=1 Tax=Uloborus diversus TaxID=327109 RepID=UPI0024098D93|nr:phospholysine phosphohistidine inorganic pyrophosphate phosphatase-like [Uloborus diversus]
MFTLCRESKNFSFTFYRRVKLSLQSRIAPSCMTKKMSSLQWDVKGVLLDITGVLYESGQKHAIPGSVEAICKLRKLNIPFRFVTNETQRTRESLIKKLQAFGFEIVEKEVFSPGVAVSRYVKENNLRPYLFIHPDIYPEFSDCDQTSPNSVVVGDAAQFFSYENMNKAFKVLISAEKPVLISMGKGRFYKENDELVMDLGGFTAALEYSTGVQAEVIGKPAPDFFLNALRDISIAPHQAVMIGDDMNSDVHAAQKCGMKGVMVKTGKFRTSDLTHPLVKPDLFVNNLAQFIDMLCNH